MVYLRIGILHFGVFLVAFGYNFTTNSRVLEVFDGIITVTVYASMSFSNGVSVYMAVMTLRTVILVYRRITTQKAG